MSGPPPPAPTAPSASTAANPWARWAALALLLLGLAGGAAWFFRGAAQPALAPSPHALRPDDAQLVERGAAIYAQQCAACHGARGAPLMPGAPDFRRIETLLRPDAQLLRSIRNGQRAMPAYFGVLKDSEILDVIAHLRTLN